MERNADTILKQPGAHDQKEAKDSKLPKFAETVGKNFEVQRMWNLRLQP